MSTRQPSRPSPGAPLANTPRHVAIIMDGNGRWARARGLPRVAGHRAGTRNLRPILRAAVEYGVEILTVYAFSTENWDRPETEVRHLLGLIERMIESELDNLHENGVRIRHLGRAEGISDELYRKIEFAEELTRENTRLQLNIAFNYGGRAEIVDAVKAIVREGIPPERIDEETIAAHLTTRGLPEPDFIIRTGGDLRLSNFLIWQAAYAEIYCTSLYWPDFGREELYDALVDYSQRKRRFGRLDDESA